MTRKPSQPPPPEGARPFLFERGRAKAIPNLRYTRFRSQFEIRFAMDLEARNIRWFYEPERLGDGRYLVDFYLPECKSWVECKGVMKKRDDIVLREVAELLSAERKQHLFLYMSNKAYIVTPGNFSPITHEQFWMLLERLRTSQNTDPNP